MTLPLNSSQRGMALPFWWFKHGRKSPWIPTLTGPFPNGQANAGSWLGTKNPLYYCAQSANIISWVPFLSWYTTAIDSITACLFHAPKKCMQSGIFRFDINATFQNTGSLYTMVTEKLWVHSSCDVFVVVSCRGILHSLRPSSDVVVLPCRT